MTASAWYAGYNAATDYKACNAKEFGYEEEEATDFYEGYGDGMDAALTYEGGICPPELRSEPEDLESWGW